MTLPTVGLPAPDFTLDSTSGSPLTLSSLRGHNVLLAFFPLAFTGTCTSSLCDFSSAFDQFAATDTVVLPISVDSVPTLNVFKKQEQLKVELLSDFKRVASKTYGTLLDAHNFSNRAYFLIDREGIVRWAFAEASPGEKRGNAEIFAKIAELS